MQTLTCPELIGRFKRSDYGQHFISARREQLESLKDRLEFAPQNLLPRLKADIKFLENWFVRIGE